MALQFLIGGSGSGKTRRLYEDLIRESIREPQTHFFAIVPEQSTMQTQKEIVELHPGHGVMNIDIVSFERLAWRIFEELAVESLAVLDDMGKSMVLRRVASGVRKDLRIYGSRLDKNGMIGELKSVLSEFFQYGITKEQLGGLADEETNPLLSQKLKDLQTLFSAFRDYTENRVMVKEEILSLLCEVLPRSELIRGSVVTLDGYTGFTPVQYRLLELLLSLCRKVTVTITMDPEEAPYRESGEEELFHLSRHTVCRLIDLASRTGCGRERDILLTGKPFWRFRESPELQFIEEELFRYGSAVYRGKGQPESLFLCQAADPMGEVRFLCGEIGRLVLEQGIRYREIAVLTGDLETYSKEIVRQFRENGIPCFIDDKKSIIANPLVELIRAALEVLQTNFSYEAVFRFLKTGLALPLPGLEEPAAEKAAAEAGPGVSAGTAGGESRQQELLFRLENYVLALGIRGFGRWNASWDQGYPGGELVNLEELNRFREAIMRPFLALKEVFSRRGVTVRERIEALVRFLEELKTEQKLEEMREQFAAAGEVELEKEYAQIYGLVLELFDRITALLGDEKTGREEFSGILDAGFSEIRVGRIPAVIDRVVVGDLMRTRLSHIKVLFFVGVNDGIVPAAPARGAILTEAERRILREKNVELAPTAREESFLQRFYLYLALTRPSRRLYLSCAACSADGKALRPSGLIGQLLRLFPEKRLRTPDEKKLARFLPALGRSWLISQLGDWEEKQTDPDFLDALAASCRTEAGRQEMERLIGAAFYSSAERGIGRLAARELYGPVLYGSVTRMELYASCAYAHFLAYGLELQERTVYELAAADIGTLFHRVIDGYFRRAKEEGRSVRQIGEEEQKRLVAECVASEAERYGNTILKSSFRNRYLTRKLERIADRTIWALTEQLRQGDFEPAGFEVRFSPADQLKAMKIPLSQDEAVQLQGRIDRLDVCEEDDAVYVSIIDYKTGNRKFDLAEIYRGLQLQLVVYMDAALEKTGRRYPEKRIIPAGIFYYHIEDPLIEREREADEEHRREEILRRLRMNGLANADREALGHLDRRLGGEAADADSTVIPVAVKNGQISERRSLAAEGARFAVLGDYVRRKIGAMGREILDGRIAVSPYKNGARTACDYCPYHAVCGFDPRTGGASYRRFPALNPEEIWEKMGEGGKAAGAAAQTEESGKAAGAAAQTEESRKAAGAAAQAEESGKTARAAGAGRGPGERTGRRKKGETSDGGKLDQAAEAGH